MVTCGPARLLADWAHSIQFGGITYLAKGSLGGPIITEGERALTTEDLGSELYRVAFRIEGYSGYLSSGRRRHLPEPGHAGLRSRGLRRRSSDSLILEDGGA